MYQSNIKHLCSNYLPYGGVKQRQGKLDYWNQVSRFVAFHLPHVLIEVSGQWLRALSFWLAGKSLTFNRGALIIALLRSANRIAFSPRGNYLIFAFSSPSLLVPPNDDTATLASMNLGVLYRERSQEIKNTPLSVSVPELYSGDGFQGAESNRRRNTIHEHAFCTHSFILNSDCKGVKGIPVNIS